MIIKILAFGVAKDIFGGGTVEVPVEENETITSLKAALVLQYPALEKLTSFMIAVNSEYAEESTVITEGDEVAIIPPVSGG